jgi:predicted Zn-dependent protease
MKEESYIAFENYLNHEMSVEEKNIFEARLENESELKEDFDLYQETTIFAAHKFSKESQDFRANLKSIATKKIIAQEPKKSKVIQLRTYVYAVAAVFVLFFGIQFFQNSIPEYSDYNQHQNALFTERSENIFESLKLAQDAFNAKNYKDAIKYFEIVLKEYPRPEVQYFYAISLVEENRHAEAEVVLNELIKGKSVYKNTATWYFALSKLKQKDYKSCKAILKMIPNDYEDYDKVEELLKKLE